MRIILAPQAFKGSISGLDAAKAFRDGVLRVLPEADTSLVPVADGGDGTLETLVDGSEGEIHECTVLGPLGENLVAQWGSMGDGKTAIIEMARTSGLALIPDEKRNPLTTTTYGLGQALKSALDKGYRKFILGIGGSATNDGGAGMAQALGIKLLDHNGESLRFGGAALRELAAIDMSSIDTRIYDTEILVACDVNNPLTGPEGASAIYGPQKGATKDMIRELDASLKKLSDIVETDLGKQIDKIPGSGAAGGLGGGIMAFLNGTLKPGVDIVLDTVGLRAKLKNADLVITGEGCLDYQTIYNKAPIGVSHMAKEMNIPTIAVCGMLGNDFSAVHAHGINAACSITNAPLTLEESSVLSYKLAADAVEQNMRLILLGAQIEATRSQCQNN